MKAGNLPALILVVALIVSAILYLDRGKITPPTATDRALPVVALPEASDETSPTATPQAQMTPVAAHSLLKEKTARYERAKEITTPDGFINSPNPAGSDKPFTLAELIGKQVILLDIWTYSCINCQRTTPYLNSWWQKYKDKGLVIVGLHTPEFEFEKKYENVRAAVEKFGIEYPVVLDNDYSTWQAYRNRYWPRKYLIDIDGYIVYDHIGEGGYEETERQIQDALTERLERLGEKGNVNVAVTKEQTVSHAGSPETYFGALRNTNLANGERGKVGVQIFTLPPERKQNLLYLGGEWNIQNEYAQSEATGASIEFRYKAKDVYFVASSEAGVQVKLYLDGTLLKGKGATVAECKLNGWCGGDDVSIDGTLRVKDDRLYHLIRHNESEEHTLRIEIESPGLKAFTFTFG